MKGSLIVVAFFCAGCMIGAANNFQYDMHSVSMYVLYALMLQVGISIGSNKKLKELIKSLRPKMLLVRWLPLREPCFSRHWPVCY